jgi:hypothetical protein
VSSVLGFVRDLVARTFHGVASFVRFLLQLGIGFVSLLLGFRIRLARFLFRLGGVFLRVPFNPASGVLTCAKQRRRQIMPLVDLTTKYGSSCIPPQRCTDSGHTGLSSIDE